MSKFTETTYPGTLRLAIPKQEKLKAPIRALLDQCGFVMTQDDDIGVLRDKRRDIPALALEFVRAADSILLMDRGVVDLAILGSDVMAETTLAAQIGAPPQLMDLNIAQCRFQIAVPEEDAANYTTVESLEGLRIATSYPALLKDWLAQNNVRAGEIIVREGGVEASIRMGIADVVADLVDSGRTLRRNNLSAVFDVARSSATLYGRQDMDCITTLKAREFTRRLRAVIEATPNADICLEQAGPYMSMAA